MRNPFPTKKALYGYYSYQAVTSPYVIMLLGYWVDRMVDLLIGA